MLTNGSYVRVRTAEPNRRETLTFNSAPTRNPDYLERLTSYGVAYRSFTEQYLDSCGLFKDAVLAILAVIAKQERVRLSERS